MLHTSAPAVGGGRQDTCFVIPTNDAPVENACSCMLHTIVTSLALEPLTTLPLSIALFSCAGSLQHTDEHNAVVNRGQVWQVSGTAAAVLSL